MNLVMTAISLQDISLGQDHRLSSHTLFLSRIDSNGQMSLLPLGLGNDAAMR